LSIFCVQAFAQGPVKGTVIIPPSSIEKPGDAGKRAHTNIRLFVPTGGFQSAQPLSGGPPYSGYLIETPASVACLFNLTKVVKGCNPNTVTAVPTGGSKVIAIVDAYDDPNAASDLAYFAQQFGLPTPNFELVYANGIPSNNADWELEESLDIEWAFAMAPKAKIILVEAASDSMFDLFTAVSKANSLVAAAGGGEVSMSWGSSEFGSEKSYDSSLFNTSGVVYFASAGDSAGVIYPSVSPNVVSAGGVTVRRNPTTGKVISIVAWPDGGGGVSAYESRPSYQSAVSSVVGSYRGTPDVSSVADPNTPLWVYDSGNGGWNAVGGTSGASPALAGVVNAAGQFASTTIAELTTVYGNMSTAEDFTDTTWGMCGPYMGYSAAKGYDFCTGIGSPKGYTGK
jgi:subtilase family serine protease